MLHIDKLRLRPLLALLFLMALGPVQAQQAPVPSPAPASQATVYLANYADDKSHVPIDEIKHFGFYQTIADPSVSNLLFRILPQGSRPDLVPAPPMNALFYVERTEPSESYAVSPKGVVWCGTHCYQLSEDDRRTVSDLIRHHVFTPEFWKNNVYLGKAVKIDDLTTMDRFNAGSLSGKPIVVEFVVDENGKALYPRVTQSCGNDELDEDACDAVKHQKFTPVTENGQPKRAYFAHTFVVGN